MAFDWYVRIGEAERGPVSSETLKHLAIDGRVTPNTPIRKGASGNWVSASRVKGLFPSPVASVTPQPIRTAAPPPIPKAQSIPMPQVTAFIPGVQEPPPPRNEETPPPSHPTMDAYQKVLLGVGAGFLAVVAVSPFLNWVNILGGGMSGIEGDGKIILVLCLCVGGGLVGELAINKRSVTSVILAQALGTIAFLWMLGEVWRVHAIRESPDIRDNIFGQILATQVGPGAGLILGMLGGLGMAVVFALLSIQCLKKTRLYAFTQAGSLLLGIGIAALLASQSSLPGNQKQGTSAPADVAMGSLLRASTPRSRPSTPGTAGMDAEPAISTSPPAIEWTDAKNPARQGSAQVRVTRVAVDKVRLKSMMGGESESKDRLCQISLRITNTDAGRKIDYQGWQGNSFMSDARLADNAGNRYKGVNFGFGHEIVGQVKSESIYPGKSVDELLIFEAPIDAAKSLKLELPASNLGETGQIRFSIAREMWSADGSKAER